MVKRKILGLLLAMGLCLNLWGCSVQSAPVSSPENPVAGTTAAQETENLAKLCKVWGYVKYRHPTYLLGQRDWDADLMELIPQVQAARQEEEVTALLHEWFVSLGEIDYGTPVSNRFYLTENHVVESESSWSEDSAYLGAELAADLAQLPKKLPNLDRSRAPVYFDTLGTPNFSNEADSAPDYGNAAFRLMGLFRLWNALEFYYPYLHLVDQEWEDCLIQAIPAMLAADDQASYESALWALAFQLDDPHITFINSSTGANLAYQNWGNYRLPAALKMAEGKLVVASVRGDCPLQAGDVLVSVGGKNVEELAQQYRERFSLSREELLLSSTQLLIADSPSREIEVTVLRDGKELALTIQGESYTTESGSSTPPYQILEGNIGLINPASISSVDAVNQAMAALKDTCGLIVDMRQYPAAPAEFFTMLHYLLLSPQPSILLALPFQSVPGVYTKAAYNFYGYRPDYPEPYYFYEQPVAVLVDYTSISASEFVATMLDTRDNAVLIGGNTVGTDGNVVMLPLPGGLAMTFTAMGCYEIDSSQSQQTGITPDIEVPYTIQGLKESRDEPLEAALKYLLSADK